MIRLIIAEAFRFSLKESGASLPCACGLCVAVSLFALAYFVNGLYSLANFKRPLTWQFPYSKATPESESKATLGKALHYAGFALAAASLIFFIVGVAAIRADMKELSVPPSKSSMVHPSASAVSPLSAWG